MALYSLKREKTIFQNFLPFPFNLKTYLHDNFKHSVVWLEFKVTFLYGWTLDNENV